MGTETEKAKGGGQRLRKLRVGTETEKAKGGDRD